MPAFDLSRITMNVPHREAENAESFCRNPGSSCTLLKLFDRVTFDLPNIWIQGDNSEVISF